MAKRSDKPDIEFGAGKGSPSVKEAEAAEGLRPIASGDLGSGRDIGSDRLLGDDIGILAGADAKLEPVDLDSVSTMDLGSGRFAGDDVDPFAEDETANKHDDGDEFGLEAKLDDLPDQDHDGPMDDEQVAPDGG